MKKFLQVVVVLIAALLGSRAHAACTGVTAGATVAQINSALSACASSGGGVVTAGAGTYNINGIVNIPCKVSLTGPVIPYQQTHYQTAIFIESVSQPFQTTAACGGSAPYQHLSYIEINGNHINNGGGGVNIVAGTNGFVVDHNWIHGSYTTSNYDGGTAMAGVLLSGGGGTINNPTQNIQITLNEFGSEQTAGDCGAAMQAADTELSQGLCVGILNDTFTKNMSWDHNIFHNMEQGAKVVEVTTNGGSTTNSGNTQNLTVSYNWFYAIHRIDFETQSNYYTSAFPSSQTINYNLLGDRDFTANTDSQGGNGQYNYDLSIANGCVNNLSLQPYCSANIDFNADIQALSTSHGSGNEIWGDANTHGNYGLFEGYVAFHGGAYQWSDQGNFQFNNNTFNIYSGAGRSTACNPGNGGYWNNENGNSPAGTPTCTGNTFSSTGTGTYTSVSPTITISGANWTVTFPTAANRDLNTNGWCTIDGTTPSPGVGSAQFYTSGTGGPVSSVTGGAIKCVGMWGAQNQATSYTSGYGYVPSAVVTQAVANTQFYISPTGSDSNNGTSSSTPWLTPNHAMACGSTITAAAGSYSAGNFQNWGTVSCSAGNNVAWLTCATFDACKISVSGQSAMTVNSSYWGVQGWETTTTSPGYACFNVQTSGSQIVHHVIFANDVANGCYGGGFQTFSSSGSAKTDYIVFIGDIAYNTSQGTDACHSGFTIGFIAPFDTLPGTHLYVAGDYGWNNVDPTTCAGTPATDGEGLIFDTLDKYGYTQQAVAENNIFVGNGGRGIEFNNNNQSTYATFYSSHNTTYGNNIQAGQDFPSNNGEIYVNQAFGVNSNADLTMTSQASTGGHAIYAFSVLGSNTSSTVSGDWLYSAAGNTTFLGSSGSFAYGSNVIGSNPNFASTTIPGAPSCSGKANVPACAATVIANFTPTTSGASAYGYQTPSTTSVTDPLYPQWLCNVALPPGLVTPGCGATAITLTGGYQGNTGGVSSITIGSAGIQQVAYGTFSDGSNHPLPFDGYSPVWSATAGTGAISITSGGVVTGTAAGTANSVFTTSPAPPGGVTFNPWGWTVTAATPTLTGVTITLQLGGSAVAVGSTVQACANMTYSSGPGTQLCGSGTDSNGTAVSNYTSSSPSNATMNSSTGILTGVAAGSTNISVTAGSLTATPLAITVTNPAVGQKVVINGAVVGGNVIIQ